MTGFGHKITGGLYLIVDANIDSTVLLVKMNMALKEGVKVVQVFDSEENLEEKLKTVIDICELCHSYQVPVFVNNEWTLLKLVPLDGVHFDRIPENYDFIKAQVNRSFMAGITCSNDLTTLQWAHQHNFDYVSFCSMFPSSSAGACEIVSLETVKKAREQTNIPIFLAGGINPDNIKTLTSISFDGVALISGIMSSPDVEQTTKLYVKSLNQIITHES